MNRKEESFLPEEIFGEGEGDAVENDFHESDIAVDLRLTFDSIFRPRRSGI
jgi:hypothetical protein